MNKNLSLRLLALVLVLVAFTTSLASCIGPATTTTTTTGGASSYPSDHVDLDDNGYCDDCGKYVIETVDIFSINDLHGKFTDNDAQPGVDEMTAYLLRMQDVLDNTVLLSAGDMWQGSSESNLTRGAIITDWMNNLNFAAMTLGNHEFDWGTDLIETNGELANFPFLAINVYYEDTNELVDWCTPSVLIDRGDCQIGIIGAVGDIKSSISAERTQNIKFVLGDELTELVKAESDSLRERGADAIIYVTHAGAERGYSGTVSDDKVDWYYDLELSDGYVDVVFEGHTHMQYAFEDSHGVYHLQCGGDNKKGIVHVEMDVNYANGNVEINTAETVNHSVYKKLTGSPLIAQLLEKYNDQISIAYTEIGYNSTYRGSDEICELVAKLYYEKGVEKWGEEYDIALGGGYLSLRSPYKIEVGTVKFADVQMILPFENRIVLGQISGADLLDKFYNTENDKYHIYYETVSAENIDRNSTYYIITDSYTSTYAPNNITEIASYDSETFSAQLLTEYIKNGGWE